MTAVTMKSSSSVNFGFTQEIQRGVCPHCSTDGHLSDLSTRYILGLPALKLSIDRRCTYNVTLRRVRATIVSVEKQCVCVCVCL